MIQIFRQKPPRFRDLLKLTSSEKSDGQKLLVDFRDYILSMARKRKTPLRRLLERLFHVH
jgi:hypothetical protein